MNRLERHEKQSKQEVKRFVLVVCTVFVFFHLFGLALLFGAHRPEPIIAFGIFDSLAALSFGVYKLGTKLFPDVKDEA